MIILGKAKKISAIRCDAVGSGEFMSRRGGRFHAGIDYECPPGEVVALERDASFVKTGQVYSATSRYRYIEVESDDLFTRYMYVKPAPEFEHLIQAGRKMFRGMRLGVVQDISAKYNGRSMCNHVHVERYYRGNIAPDNITHFYDQKKDRTYIDPV